MTSVSGELPGLGEPLRLSAQEQKKVTPEILADPSVLRAKANDLYSSFNILNGDYYLTPPQDLVVEVSEDKIVELKLGLGHPRDVVAGDLSIFALSTEDKTLLPWYSLGQQGVVNGQGVKVENLAERLRVRAILDNLGLKLTRSILAESDKFEPYNFFKEKIAEEVESLEQRARTLRHIAEDLRLDTASPAAKLGIRIVSHWEGERPVDNDYNLAELRLVSEALVRAVAEFRAANNRSDAQAAPHVSVSQGSASYEVPNEVVEPVFRMFGAYSGWEQSAIDRLLKND